jgi:hypothetical protein
MKRPGVLDDRAFCCLQQVLARIGHGVYNRQLFGRRHCAPEQEKLRSLPMTSPRQRKPAVPRTVALARLPASTVATGVFDRLQHIHTVLAPVIGQRGVLALYERSRHLSSRAYPWLAVPDEGLSSGMDLENLRLLVARQDDDEAAAGAGFLLESFHDLLAGLVGITLTRQLIGTPPTTAAAADDPS